MSSLRHEAVIELLREHPSLVAGLVRARLGAPEHAVWTVDDSTLRIASPVEVRIDLVLVAGRGRRRRALAVEVQLDRRAAKRFVWPLYLWLLRRRLRCPVALAVLTFDPVIARWAAEPVESGHPGARFAPIVLGPGELPRITRVEDAAASPGLAFLSALAHVRSDRDAEVLRAAVLGAWAGLEPEEAERYDYVLRAMLATVAPSVLESLMPINIGELIEKYGTPKEKADYRRGKAEGVAEGKAEGKAAGALEAKAAAVLEVLRARRLRVLKVQRQAIEGCRDAAQLDRWLRRAVTARTTADVLAEDA